MREVLLATAAVAGSTVITSGEQALTGTVIRFTDPECRK